MNSPVSLTILATCYTSFLNRTSTHFPYKYPCIWIVF
uniref:Uncharacterized protein n=1 Tax=Salmonella phage PMBT26 TaxID=3229745 RepID=A0AB39C2B2_9CAUD